MTKFLEKKETMEQLKEVYFGSENLKYTPKEEEFLFTIEEDNIFYTYFIRNENLILIYLNEIPSSNCFETLDEIDDRLVQEDFELALLSGKITLEQFSRFFTPYQEIQ